MHSAHKDDTGPDQPTAQSRTTLLEDTNAQDYTELRDRAEGRGFIVMGSDMEDSPDLEITEFADAKDLQQKREDQRG